MRYLPLPYAVFTLLHHGYFYFTHEDHSFDRSDPGDSSPDRLEGTAKMVHSDIASRLLCFWNAGSVRGGVRLVPSNYRVVDRTSA